MVEMAMNRSTEAGSPRRKARPKILMILGAGLLLSIAMSGNLSAFQFAGITRDTFPVFNNPSMLRAAEAENRGIIFPRDAVIGVVLGGKAKAYPITIMGFHELGNDTLNGIPIAVSW